MALSDGGTGSCGASWLALQGAEQVRSFGAGPLAGSPVVTRHRVGSGTAWYVATTPDRATLADLVATVAREAGVRPAADVPDGVEAVRRGDRLFVLNHTAGRSRWPGRACRPATCACSRPADVLAEQRRALILDEVRRVGGVRVYELTRKLGVSDMTVRRDLDALARQGVLEKVHGGAARGAAARHEEPGFEAKSGRS